MDAIAGFLSENWLIVLVAILALIGFFWLVTRFLKLTLIAVVVVVILMFVQNMGDSQGDFKTRVNEAYKKISVKAGKVVESARGFFTTQKENMHKHLDDASKENEKTDRKTDRKTESKKSL